MTHATAPDAATEHPSPAASDALETQTAGTGPQETSCTCGASSKGCGSKNCLRSGENTAASTPCSRATRCLAGASQTFNQWLTYGQAAALIAIAAAAIGGIGQAGWEMIAARAISLGDLLMLFLYVEILSMVKGSALGTREIPIRMPIALAIVAAARYIVVDVEHISANAMLFTALSILVLVAALWLVRRTETRKAEAH